MRKSNNSKKGKHAVKRLHACKQKKMKTYNTKYYITKYQGPVCSKAD